MTVPDPPPGPPHLVIGPSNSAGQGHAWAGAVREHLPEWTARSLYVHAPQAALVFPADTRVHTTEWFDPACRQELADRVLAPATHVLVETLRAVVATATASSRPVDHLESPAYRAADVLALRRSGRQVGVLLHGSEVRSPDHHAMIEPWSPFRHPAEHAEYVERLRRRTRWTQEGLALLRDADVPVFVSTLDLLDHVPDALWLPVVVQPHAAAPPFTGPRPVVGHLPSNGFLKGTAAVLPVLERLEGRGVLRSAVPGTVTPDEVGTFLAGVDVIVDQLVLGNPGVLAAQAMAAGRLVVAHVAPSVRRRFPEPLPVVESTPEDLEDVLRDVAAHPDHYAEVAAAGPGFIGRLHDGRRSAAVLGAHLLGDSAPGTPG